MFICSRFLSLSWGGFTSWRIDATNDAESETFPHARPLLELHIVHGHPREALAWNQFLIFSHKTTCWCLRGIFEPIFAGSCKGLLRGWASTSTGSSVSPAFLAWSTGLGPTWSTIGDFIPMSLALLLLLCIEAALPTVAGPWPSSKSWSSSPIVITVLVRSPPSTAARTVLSVT